MHKITRLSYNSESWQHPTGDAKGHEASGTYNQRHGFGHEDWLFRTEWQIDGWRYAFIQGVNASYRRLTAEKKPFDLTLFTIQPDKRRRYVATIKAVECLEGWQAEAALTIFKEKGWFDKMLEEIKAVNGDVKALGDSAWAWHVLNIRFRVENVIRCKADEFVSIGDPVMKFNRYRLNDFNESTRKTNLTTLRQRKGSGSLPVSQKVFRRGTAAIEYTPEHAAMQKKLLNELKNEFPREKVEAERDYVDISVRTETELLLFEIKSDLEPRLVIRQALGQILEYAFHPQRTQKLPVRLFIVGRCSLPSTEQDYLDRLCREFSLPLKYRVVDI